MSAPNPYQSSGFVEENGNKPSETIVADAPKEEIDQLSRRLSRIGQMLLIGYFVALLPAWLSLAMSVWMSDAAGLARYFREYHGHLILLAALMGVGLVGGVGCSFTPRRERFYLGLANFLKILVGGAGFWMLLSVRAPSFSFNLMPLFLAVLFAMWMASEAAVLGFLRASAYRNDERLVGHGCELAIGLLATSAGCFSWWSLINHTAESITLSGLLFCVTVTTSLAVSITIWVLRWFPIIRSGRADSAS
ncbi:hypothetical protein [Aporhodopirellula aestuarii]|uniref:Uncharacterized protein n=1 Tax=Aporhodopirellula aestuarii TaxID=2950107 RepID=A0ABT0U9Z6_9BACT|nr:hypothetical protein [Aporhodopirellula aestuarii]MCM2373819.1 hypothetical protein [Aporhodopirellula aestuarii]